MEQQLATWGGGESDLHQQTCFSTSTITNNDQLSTKFGHLECYAGCGGLEMKGSVCWWVVENASLDGEARWRRKKTVVMGGGWVVSEC